MQIQECRRGEGLGCRYSTRIVEDCCPVNGATYESSVGVSQQSFGAWCMTKSPPCYNTLALVRKSLVLRYTGSYICTRTRGRVQQSCTTHASRGRLRIQFSQIPVDLLTSALFLVHLYPLLSFLEAHPLSLENGPHRLPLIKPIRMRFSFSHRFRRNY